MLLNTEKFHGYATRENALKAAAEFVPSYITYVIVASEHKFSVVMLPSADQVNDAISTLHYSNGRCAVVRT